jgi:UDP-glucose 4-epimerase
VGLEKESEFKRINVQATRMLAEMAADAGIRSFIFTSTTALYGHAATAASKAAWLDESLVPEPRTIYHETKLEAEALLEDIAETSGLNVVALRMSRCFPEPAPVMAAYRLHRGVDARDVADAHACALEKGYPGFRKYVISGASPFRVEDAALLHENASAVIQDREPLLAEAFTQRGWRLPETIDRVCDPSRAMTELGWAPRFGFSEVLEMLDEQSSEVLPP